MSTREHILSQSLVSLSTSDTTPVFRLPSIVGFTVSPGGYNLRNKLYAWSKQHNITFIELDELHAPLIGFGRPQDLTAFLLSWPHPEFIPRVIR